MQLEQRLEFIRVILESLESKLSRNKMDRQQLLESIREYRKIGKEIQTEIMGFAHTQVKHGNGLKGTQEQQNRAESPETKQEQQNMTKQ